MKEKPMRRVGSEPLTPEQAAELERLAALPDDEIDTREMLEQRDWSMAQRGLTTGIEVWAHTKRGKC